jgi:hypothetical protein
MTDEPDKAGNPEEKGRETPGNGMMRLRALLGDCARNGWRGERIRITSPRLLIETLMEGLLK